MSIIFKGGIIIIGSLLWKKNEYREKWRCQELELHQKIKVKLPIRYGRKSVNKTKYTMVLSRSCNKDKTGVGWVVPFKHKFTSFKKFQLSAQKLGKAEGINDNDNLVANNGWGAIGLLSNPDNPLCHDYLDKWKKTCEAMLNKNSILNNNSWLKSESPVIDKEGILKIKWPECIDKGEDLQGYNFLFASAMNPELNENGNRYPSIEKIVRSIKDTKDPDYFIQNQYHEITTFQDKKIAKCLGNRFLGQWLQKKISS